MVASSESIPSYHQLPRQSAIVPARALAALIARWSRPTFGSIPHFQYPDTSVSNDDLELDAERWANVFAHRVEYGATDSVGVNRKDLINGMRRSSD